MRLVRVSILAVLAASCGCKKPRPSEPRAAPVTAAGDAGTAGDAAAAERKPLYPPSDPAFARYEGAEFLNACGTDADCKATGCSSEVCAAEVVVSTCDVLPRKPSGACGCVAGLCQWYTDGPAP